MLQETASEVAYLGKEWKRKEPWVTDAILELSDSRRELKKQNKSGADARKQYTLVNIETRQKIIETKDNCIRS